MALTFLSGLAIAQNVKAEVHQLSSTQNQYDWTGFYGGLNIGGVFNDTDLNSNHFGLTDPSGVFNANSNFSSFFPGVQLGYLRQLESNIVLGVEGDVTYNVHQTGKVSCNCPVTPSVSDHYAIKNRLQGAIRGRLGYLVKPQIIPFLSAGGSFADLGIAYNNEGDDFYSKNITQSGWLVGGGLEWGFAHNWSVRAEYYYIDYSGMNMKIPNIYGLNDPNGNAHVNLHTNNARFAINYWF